MFLPPDPARWPAPATAYEAEAIRFCEAWLSGQDIFVLHTSGSTGTPKPISLTRTQMQASAHLTGQTFGLQAGDHALVCLNVRYIAGVMMLVRGLELGLPMTILEPSGNPLNGLHPAIPFAFTALVPLQLQTILEQQDETQLAILNSMKAILVGGAATGPALEQALQVITAPVFATYGMTETVSHIAIRQLNGPQATDYFTALTGVEIGTDDRDCLHITAAASNFERVQTNDVVEFLTDPPYRTFRIMGRADSIINSGGVKIQPEKVERIIQEQLATHGLNPRLFVAGIPDERLGQQLVAVVEGIPVPDDVWQAVQQAIRGQLGPYHVPKQIICADRFAETPTGKIDRKQTVAQVTGQA
ncbi:AMP-binding protein [Arsenicibacter rosenii]|uniref:O-succinylbenzoic acid--CoA ligase n=1 Tax=Arsenicibacter rosenii TaxID=1750698 RepID=A0A1S2VM59_9BACT|nr:AMP-binding protein [Arsenicibacter rosenii]OIN59867.1 O-succinylbenzoic acid--CoA ligase [Arsenicibacter rosenii]